MRQLIIGLLSLAGFVASAHAGSVHCYTVSSYNDDYNRSFSVANDTILGGDSYSTSWNGIYSGMFINQCKDAGKSFANLSLPIGPLPAWREITVTAYLGFGDSVDSILQSGNYTSLGVVYHDRH